MSTKVDEKGGGGGDGGKEPTTTELREQIENLNKGIAGYRDQANSSKEASEKAQADAKAAKDEVDRLTKVIEEAAKPDVDEKEVALAPADQKKLEKWAKDNGFVTKAELDVEKAKLFQESLATIETQAVNEFLEAHPEYNKDENWAKVKEQFGVYKQPTTLVGYRQLLTRIHNELNKADEAVARARAQEEQKRRLGLGGGSQKDGGGDEDPIDAMQKKYPNLSRETIISRLEEINNLAQERKERREGKK